jgi:hypothetical protein
MMRTTYVTETNFRNALWAYNRYPTDDWLCQAW